MMKAMPLCAGRRVPGASCKRQGRRPKRRLRRSENPRARWPRVTSEANAVDPLSRDADDFQAFCNFSRGALLHWSAQELIAEFGVNCEPFRRR